MNRILEIETIELRIPGLSRFEARRAAMDIVQQVSRAMPGGGPRQRLGKLDVRIKVPEGVTSEQLVKLVAQAILEKLV